MAATHAVDSGHARAMSFMERLNAPWHERALQVFMVIVLAHWAEHLFQTFQIYVLGWPVPQSLGALGLAFPWLVKSEVMHYGYALVMLAGLWMLRGGFTGAQDRRWWTIALWIQFFHHIEHLLLQIQALFGFTLFGGPVPMSLAQVFVPRVELHLFYNTIVFVPMVVAMYHHMFPTAEEAATQQCSCAWHAPLVSAVQPG